MAKSSVQPELFSRRFNVPPAELERVGVFDPTLNIDTLLFPDPLLLERSKHPEMKAARSTFDSYFERVLKLLYGSQEVGDKPWRAAERLLSFPEIKGTCLGYGAATIRGHGSGPQMRKRLLVTGKQIIRLGIDDPDLFQAMGLFEEDFGPDLIGDMFTNVAFGEIAEFNKRIINELGLPSENFNIKLQNGSKYQAEFVRNSLQDSDNTPVILMPTDILRALPIATSWAEVQAVASENEEFREQLNSNVATIWAKKTLENKEQLRRWALSSPQAFGSLLDLLHGHDGKPYDFLGDPHGELVWRTIGQEIVKRFPFNVNPINSGDSNSVIRSVEGIIEQFKFLIEDRDIWKELYTDSSYGTPRFEKSAQRLFYATALSYCENSGVDITPEAETGRGPVDFKFSKGIDSRILVEMKLSTNNQVVKGFEKQLDAYNSAEKPVESYYVVINVGNLNDKWSRIEKLREAQISIQGSAPNIILINGLSKASASTLR